VRSFSVGVCWDVNGHFGKARCLVSTVSPCVCSSLLNETPATLPGGERQQWVCPGFVVILRLSCCFHNLWFFPCGGFADGKGAADQKTLGVSAACLGSRQAAGRSAETEAVFVCEMRWCSRGGSFLAQFILK